MKILKKNTSNTGNTLTKNTLEVYGRMKRECEISWDITVLREIKKYPEFIPSKHDTMLNIWGGDWLYLVNI